jgi:hypothetical protein
MDDPNWEPSPYPPQVEEKFTKIWGISENDEKVFSVCFRPIRAQ